MLAEIKGVSSVRETLGELSVGRRVSADTAWRRLKQLRGAGAKLSSLVYIFNKVGNSFSRENRKHEILRENNRMTIKYTKEQGKYT